MINDVHPSTVTLSTVLDEPTNAQGPRFDKYDIRRLVCSPLAKMVVNVFIICTTRHHIKVVIDTHYSRESEGPGLTPKNSDSS